MYRERFHIFAISKSGGSIEWRMEGSRRIKMDL
jgi:hypothetical protein